MKYRENGVLYDAEIRPPTNLNARLVGASRVLDLCPTVLEGLPEEIAEHYRDQQARRMGTGVPEAGPYAAERIGERVLVYCRTLKQPDRWVQTSKGWVKK